MTTDTLTLVFAALADPTRRAILERLAKGEATVSQLAKPFAISQPAISKHLKVLEKAGLVARARDAQWRPARLEADGMRQVTQWLERCRRTWEARYDRLDTYLEKLQEEERKSTTPRRRKK